MQIRKNVKTWVACGVAAIGLMGVAAPAQAQLKINLVDNGGVTGSAAELGFKIAAGYWESVISTNVTINLGVGYSALGTGIIGSTGSARYSVATEDVIDALKAVGNSALDASAVLPTLSTTTFNDPTFGAVHGISMVRNAARTGNLGINVNASQYDTSITTNNVRLTVTEANLKALGYTGFAAGNDANVTFSSAFSFDFDPTNGITAGQMDFIGVAIHEIGHALGFTSGVDLYDQYSGVGPNASIGNGVNWNNQSAGSVLDLFRYSSDPRNVAPGTTPVLDWSVGTASYFSLDGGNTQFDDGSLMSTGAYNGDGRQASHFKDTASSAGGCNGYNQIGVMDPTFCYGEMGVITATDLAAFDAIGWNINLDVLANKGYTINTAQIYTALTAVPEPLSWATMLFGFALAGGAMRRRRAEAGVAIAA
ncbi:NF038122 family metalloprotease [Sphingomonas sp. R1]|uniref:NF038122 family metalloprotease n=1 Tax=Sphingomonas sp. R1 TaxID=399176 RepID=UPI0022251C86|nr:NF038122 family metalloprotease [Sphingomonas sp. R1]UYY78745.1 NF038122 family metalloprotease [Sphingomonas sp. R1]